MLVMRKRLGPSGDSVNGGLQAVDRECDVEVETNEMNLKKSW
jgi:hypothetical protein